MKKFLLSFCFLIAAAIGWAGTVTLTTNATASTWTPVDDAYTTTIDGWNVTYEKANSTNDCVAPMDDHIRVYKNARLTIAPAASSSQAIVKVVLSCTASKYCGEPTPAAGTVTVDATNYVITWEGAANQVVLDATTSQIRVKTIEITTADAGAVLAPTITPAGGEYVAGDEVEVTISGVSGQDLYYALNSDDAGEAEEYSTPLKVTSNTTIYAWASDGTTVSEAASATFNFTAPIANVAAFYQLEKDNAVKFTGALTAVYQNGNNLIVKDESGTMLVYGNVGQTYNNGDAIAAGVSGKVGVYGGNLQLVPTAESFAAGVAGTAVAPVVKTVADLASCSLLDYVKLEGVYFTLDEGKTKNYTISDGTNTFAAYNQFNIAIEGLAEGVTYNLEGFVSSYNGNAQLQPTSIAVADASGITGVSTLEETFDSALPTTWTCTAVSGDVSFYQASYSNNGYAAASAYKATVLPVDKWLVTPALNVKDAELKTISFKTQVNAYGSTSTGFKVYVLDNVDPAKATLKTELTATLATAPESGYSEWAESGEIDLSTYGDLVYIGFQYTAPETACATWCVDDFKFNVKPEEQEFLGTKETPLTVAEALKAYVDGESKGPAWVKGYIVGYLNGSIDKPVFSAEEASATNLLLADTDTCTNVDSCLVVQLPKGDIRTMLNLADNAANLGAVASICGDIVKYFNVAGLKNGTDYVLEVNTASVTPVTGGTANPFAYGLKGELSDNLATMNVSFSLNTAAESVSVVVRNEAGEEYIRHDLGALAAGTHKAEILTPETMQGTFTWEVEVAGAAKTAIEEFVALRYYHPRGVDVDNNMESDNFGSIYVTEGMETSSETYYSATNGGVGLYIFNPDMTSVVNEVTGKAAFMGGFTYSFIAYGADLARVRVAEDGRIFVTRCNSAGDYIAYAPSQADLVKNDKFTSLLSGGELNADTYEYSTTDGFLAAGNIGFDVKGAGEDLKLIALSANKNVFGFNASGSRVDEYTLGTAEVLPAPANVAALSGYTIAPQCTNVEYDDRGGVWYCQYRGAPSEVNPALIYVDADGVQRYFEGDGGLVRGGGGVRISPDGTQIAIATSKKTFSIYDVRHLSDGSVKLLERTQITHGIGTNVYDIAWDLAGNMYICGNSGEYLKGFALPRTGAFTTKAAAKYAFVLESSAIENVEVDANAPVEYYNLQGVKVANPENGIFIKKQGNKTTKVVL